MGYRFIWIIVLLALGVLGPPVASSAENPKESQAEDAAAKAVFPMQEISLVKLLRLSPDLSGELTRGGRAGNQKEPFSEVKAYPELRSKKPVYGLIRVGSDPLVRDSGTPVYFVIDESGEKPPEKKPEPKEPEKKEESILDTLGAALGLKTNDKPVPPKLPELKNTYDRLYVDLNGDLDLTNDPPVTPQKTPPGELVVRYSSILQCVVFDEISVPADFGEELGKRPVRLIPRLQIQEYKGEEYPAVGFIAATVRHGDIKLGKEAYKAILAQRYVITGRYDLPSTGLLMTSSSNPNARSSWWGGDQLSAMRPAGDTYYTTSTTPLGDKLIVERYQGPMGVLKIGPGDRKIENLSIQGSLHTKENVSVPVGRLSGGRGSSLEPVSECKLPVGDYIPDYVSIEYGDLRFSISENYHSDGKGMAIDRDAWVYGIKIREDKPFVWDFSNKPEVMFTSPAKDQTYQPGDEVSVKGVLIDPKLTIMIRRLNDAGRMEEKTVDQGNGQTYTYKQQASLDPQVTITDASGKQIAEGPMPFG